MTDQGTALTIPPLEDLSLWTAYDDARKALGPHLSQRAVATRYR